MKTLFNHELIIKLVKNSALIVQGVRKVYVSIDNIKNDVNEIYVDVWFKQKIFNLKFIANELQKTIYFNLSKQLDNTQIKINIVIRT